MTVNKRPKCSVCIANYNGASYIENCIKSILNQDFNHDVEIIVHDDASSDNSRFIIEKNFPSVKLIVSNTNVGYCKSNNKMVEIAKGEYILLLNNDAELHSDALHTLYQAIEINNKSIFGLPQYNANNGELIDIGCNFDLFFNPMPNLNKKRYDVGMVIGACLFLSKELWDTLGGFPEWFGSLAEDMYLCCIARLRGYDVTALSTSGYNHWVGQSIGGGKVTNERKLCTTFTRRALSERNKTFVMLIYYPILFLILIFPVHLFFLLFEGLVLSLLKFDFNIWNKIYWKALNDIWCYHKILFKTRSINQNFKSCSNAKLFTCFSIIPRKVIMFLDYGIPRIQ